MGFTFWMVAIAVTVVTAQEASAEPIVKETREGGISVIRITPDEGAERSTGSTFLTSTLLRLDRTPC